MTTFFRKLTVIFALLISIFPLSSYAQSDSPAQVTLISSTTHLGQSNSVLMGVKVSLRAGWYMYAPQQDSSFSPPRIENAGSTNITALQLLWPKVKEKKQYGIKALVYEGENIFPLVVSIKSSSQEVTLKADFSFVGCHKGQCIPFTIPLSYVLKPGEISSTIDTESLEAALKGSSYEPQKKPLECGLSGICTTGMILLFAFLGGFLLNFMPCVLPVLSLKVFSLLKKKISLDSIEKSSIRGRFLMSFLGILSFFIAFSLLTIVMKAFGHTLGWGVHFQQPVFLLLMITILGIFGLNLWGFFEIRLPSWLLGWMGDINTRLYEARRNSYIKDFFSGLLTALLATPCTAPFLGIAVGASLAYSYTGTFLVFMMIGIGLGFPYLILATFPRVLQILPKPGAWMEKLKKILALGLWATALWLVYVLVMPLMENSKEDTWHAFEEEKISKLVQEGTPVLVNITASWCLTCKANDFFVFKNAKVQEILKEQGVYLMQGDWTRPDVQIQLFLKKYHRAGIPFTLYYSSTYPTGKVLPELLTTAVMEEILKE